MFRKGQFVHYDLGPGKAVEAIVRRVHRDGTVTVEARFFLENGERQTGYLGYKYRYEAETLKAL